MERSSLRAPTCADEPGVSVPEGEAEELPPRLVLALQHLSHTSISCLQAIARRWTGEMKPRQDREPSTLTAAGSQDTPGAEACLALPAHITAVCVSCRVYAQVRAPRPHSLVLPEVCSWLEESRPKALSQS